jgi:hypothetical protein
MHGESVQYKVASSIFAPFFVAKRMAFSSACKASEQLPLESRSHPVSGHSSSQLCVPAGGPLYPIEMMRVCLVNTAPTCARTQCERAARSVAKFMYISLNVGFKPILLLMSSFCSNLFYINTLAFQDTTYSPCKENKVSETNKWYDIRTMDTFTICKCTLNWWDDGST